MKLSLICLDFCRSQKLFAESPKDSDDAGRADICASHTPFRLGVRGLPVWSLRPAPPHPPAAGVDILAFCDAVPQEAVEVRVARKRLRAVNSL